MYTKSDMAKLHFDTQKGKSVSEIWAALSLIGKLFMSFS